MEPKKQSFPFRRLLSHEQQVEIILRTNPHCVISHHVGWINEPCRCEEILKRLCQECQTRLMPARVTGEELEALIHQAVAQAVGEATKEE